ncbi:hypothetical protein [Bifidobacterium felsineum]|uniref:hypothetical protein n=1 Tax=Bifidobacterium felsineum TaxID=2045440 RepID=UPI001BDD5B58|nr:hypothetical protein [Bifidobacterium felsineum]MBT1164963.1 hypothetical protein [Bifidobacterium felsineum]
MLADHLLLLVSGLLSALLAYRLAVPFADASHRARVMRGRIESFLWDLLYRITVLLMCGGLILACIGLTLTLTGIIET